MNSWVGFARMLLLQINKQTNKQTKTKPLSIKKSLSTNVPVTDQKSLKDKHIDYGEYSPFAPNFQSHPSASMPADGTLARTLRHH